MTEPKSDSGSLNEKPKQKKVVKMSDNFRFHVPSMRRYLKEYSLTQKETFPFVDNLKISSYEHSMIVVVQTILDELILSYTSLYVKDSITGLYTVGAKEIIESVRSCNFPKRYFAHIFDQYLETHYYSGVGPFTSKDINKYIETKYSKKYHINESGMNHLIYVIFMVVNDLLFASLTTMKVFKKTMLSQNYLNAAIEMTFKSKEFTTLLVNSIDNSFEMVPITSATETSVSDDTEIKETDEKESEAEESE